jgi:hypothetical protein
MKKFISLIFISALSAIMVPILVHAQGKGVDQQNDRIRDISTERAPGNNGIKQDVGAGRGMDFGRGRTPVPVILPNPYRFTAKHDAIIQAVEELLQERKLILDSDASKKNQGLLITQPFTFTKGLVATAAELSQLADVPNADSQGWTRGRYTFIVEVQPIDTTSTNVSVNIKIEGRADAATGAEWVTLNSNGTAEQDFLASLIEKITGSLPPGYTKTP